MMHRTTILKRFGASAGVTALLASGAVALVPTQAAAQQACYPPVPQGFNCDGTPASPAPVGGIGSPIPSASASPSGSPSASPTASGAPSIAPTASQPAGTTPPASPTGSPRPVPCEVPIGLSIGQDTITAMGAVTVSVRATPNSIIDLFAYTRPNTSFSRVRSAELGADGVASFLLVPPGNTRIYAAQRGCEQSQSSVINVRRAMSIAAVRNSPRNYTFSGRVLPARAGTLVNLYRVEANGRQVLTSQARTDSTGRWSVNRVFTGSGRFGFVARTGQDLNNAASASNVRPTVIH
jgi:hypothetical protein